MNNVFEYAAYFIPPGFVALSQVYRMKFNRLRDTGKIPNIMQAKQRQITFMVMAVVSVVVIILVSTQF